MPNALVRGALNILKSQGLTSIHGRKLFTDHHGFLVGHPGARLPYENSTAASTLANYGTSILSGSTADFTLGAPPAIGVEKVIVNASTLSTAVMGVVRSSSGAFSFGGSTANGAPTGARINLNGNGAAVRLLATALDVWTPIGAANYATTAQSYVTVTTSS
jgi:hypothetical protein